MNIEIDQNVKTKVEKARNVHFPHLKQTIYLDNSASAVYSVQQIQQYSTNLSSNLYGNPHSFSKSSQLSQNHLQSAKEKVLKYFEVTSDDFDVIFTSGATAACQMVAENFNFKTQKSSFIYLEDNHTSVVGMREVVEANTFCLSTKLPPQKTNIFSLDNYSLLPISTAATSLGVTSSPANHLFVYPLQSNFSGTKYPLEWVKEVQMKKYFKDLISTDEDNFYIFLDAASFLSTSPLSLSDLQPDFVCFSFYKIFGFPTGLGALLVSKRASCLMTSRSGYFGGGSVTGYLPSRSFVRHNPQISARFERGTPNYLDVIAVDIGFEILREVAFSIHHIQDYTFALTRQLHASLTSLHHSNGTPVAVIYANTRFDDVTRQGPIIAMNFCNSRGDFIGFNHVTRLAASSGIEVRGGCMCNVGACVRMLEIDADRMRMIYRAGHRCGGDDDVIDGTPVGAVRVSLGYHSTVDDVIAFIRFITENFVEDDITAVTESGDDVILNNDDVTKPDCDVIVDNDNVTEGDHDVIAANDDVTDELVLKKIFVYPVKSCRGVEVDDWMISSTSGLLFDRIFAVVTKRNRSCYVKRDRLAYVIVAIDLDRKKLQLSSEGHGSVEEDLICSSEDQEVFQIEICGEMHSARCCDVTTSNWLSAVVRDDVILIRLSDHRSMMSFSNQAQLLLINEQSVRALDNRLHTNRSDDVTMIATAARFRANFLIGGHVGAFDEEKWTKIKLDDCSFIKVANCVRCRAIRFDAKSGERNEQVVKQLAGLVTENSQPRRHFGIYLRGEFEKSLVRLKVGTKLHVT